MGVILERTRKESGLVVENYKDDRYDDYYIALRAHHNCKRCFGRGKLHFTHPTKDTEWVELCSCINK